MSVLEFEVIQQRQVQRNPKNLVSKFFFLMEMAYDLVDYRTEDLRLELVLALALIGYT